MTAILGTLTTLGLGLPAVAQQWVPVPLRTQAMKTAGLAGGEGGQIITNIDVDATGNVLLMGTDVGGLYMSTNGGNSWVPRNAGYKPRGSAYVAIDPNNSSRFISIGANGSTGANGANAIQNWHGIWRSTDQGSSWTNVLPKRTGYNDHNGADDRGFDQVAYDPSSKGTYSYSRTIYWLTPGDAPTADKGLWKSIDGGDNWNLISGTSGFAGGFVRVHPTSGRVYVGSKAGFYYADQGSTSFTQTLTGEVWGVAVSKAEPDSVWITQGTVVKKNTASGTGTWSTLGASGLPAASTATGAHNLERIQVSPKDTNYIAVRQHVASWQSFPQRITTNGGTTWSGPRFASQNSFIGVMSGRTYAVAFHPIVATTVWNAGGDMVQKSTDGGLNYVWSNNGYLGLAIAAHFNFNPNNPDLMFVTSQDYNSASSTDGGDTWKYQDVNQTNWIHDGREDPGWGGWQYGGTAITSTKFATFKARWWGDYGFLSTTSNAGGTWGRDWTTTTLENSSSNHSLVCPGDPNVVFLGKYRSEDGGNSWVAMPNYIKGVATYDMNPSVAAADKTLYAIGNRESDGKASIYKSNNKGVSWQIVFTDTGSYTFEDVAYDWKAGRLWIAFGALGSYTISSGTWNWQAGNSVPLNNNNTRRFKWVTVDPVDPSIVYAGGSGDLYMNSMSVVKSVNSGASWVSLTAAPGSNTLDGGRESTSGRVHPTTRELWVLCQCFGVWRYGAANTPTSTANMDVQGNSISITDGDSTPSTSDATDFGSVGTGSNVSKTFTIRNTGTASLSLSGTPIVIIGGTNAVDFSVTTQPSSSVSAAGSTTFVVRFAPSAAGTRSATISIANSDTGTNKNPYNFSIQGTGVALGAGTGLTGQYFPNTTFTASVKTQIDPTIDKQWNTGAPLDLSGNPIASMPVDNFGVRWTGQIQAVESGSYTISAVADDTAKVWINDLTGTPILNQTAYNNGNPTNGTFTMNAGQKYDAKIDFTDISGNASMQLKWTRPGGTSVIIPQSQLYPTSTATTNGTTNLALAANATASESASGYPATNANDGSATTRWSANGDTGKWLQMELAQNYSNLTKVVLKWEQSWSVYQYKVEVSENGTSGWTTVIDQTARTTGVGASTTHTFNATSGKFVRVTATGLPGGQWPSLYEFEIY